MQRLELLKSFVRESAPNKDLKSNGYNLTSLLSAGARTFSALLRFAVTSLCNIHSLMQAHWLSLT